MESPHINIRSLTLFVSLTPRGFTGHEMMDGLDLVNMNGRIYDGLLGRFLSADLLVSNPSSLQSYNRYSYVANNPLSTADPSGFESEAERNAREKKAWDDERHAQAAALHKSLEDGNAVVDAAASIAADHAQPSATPAKSRSDSQQVATGSDRGKIKSQTPETPAGQVTGTAPGTGTSDTYPFRQECDFSCWAASTRNYLHDSGVPDDKIPTEAAIRGLVADKMAEGLSTLDTGDQVHAAGVRTGTIGLLQAEVRKYLLPILESHGVPSRMVQLSNSTADRGFNNNVLAHYSAARTPIMAKQNYGDFGHMVMFRQTANTPVQITLTDPWGPVRSTTSGPDLYRTFNMLNNKDAYFIVPSAVPTPNGVRNLKFPDWN